MRYVKIKLILHRYQKRLRKDAGVVERDGLENRCTLSGTQGSNPCLSATNIWLTIKCKINTQSSSLSEHRLGVFYNCVDSSGINLNDGVGDIM